MKPSDCSCPNRTDLPDPKPPVALFRPGGRSTHETVVRESAREIYATGQRSFEAGNHRTGPDRGGVTASDALELALPTLSGYLSGEFQRLEAVVGQCSDCRGASAVRRCMPDGAAGSGGVGARRGPQRSEPSWSGAIAVVAAVYALQELTDRLSIRPSPRRSSGGPDCRRRRAPALPLIQGVGGTLDRWNYRCRTPGHMSSFVWH